MAYYECINSKALLESHYISETYNTSTVYINYTLGIGDFYLALSIRYNYITTNGLDPYNQITCSSGITKSLLSNILSGNNGQNPAKCVFVKLSVTTSGKVTIEIPSYYKNTHPYYTYYSCLISGNNSIIYS